MCVVSYVLQLDNVERRAHLGALLDGFAAAMGGDVEVRDPDQIKAEFISGLSKPMKDIDPGEFALRSVLGVGLRG